MLLNYLPVLIYMIICIGLIGVMLLLVRIPGQEEALPRQGHAL